MVYINANLDLKTNEVIKTGRLNERFEDLCNDELGITLVARDRSFMNEAWKSKGKTYLRVVLPYEEVLNSNNIDLLIAKELYKQLDKISWLDVESIKHKLEMKMLEMA